MSIEQLKYIVALFEKGNFREAAAECNISQPALSMSIKNLENELNTTLINRQRTPVELTPAGLSIIDKFKSILSQIDSIYSTLANDNELSGNIKLGVIPTLAPYILPLFLGDYLQKYPKINLQIEESKTSDIIDKLKRHQLDVGIIVTPVTTQGLITDPLFYEEFYLYSNKTFDKDYILHEDINPNELWLLQEGHCMRNQIINLCELKKDSAMRFSYNAGSIETLMNLVDQYKGTTIIPELASMNMEKAKKSKLKSFVKPTPVREVSLCYHRYTPYLSLVQTLKDGILASIPSYMKDKEDFEAIEVGAI